MEEEAGASIFLDEEKPFYQSQSTFNNNQFDKQYQPPILSESSDDDDDNDDDEAPFSIKIEMDSLLHGKRNFETSNSLHDLNLNLQSHSALHVSDKFSAANCLLETRQLDLFLQRIYKYYTGKGLFAIILTEVANLLVMSFIISFSTFLIWCVNHPLIREKKRLSDVLVEHCVSSIPILPLIFLMTFWCWWSFRVINFFLEYPKLCEMQRFYNEALEIADSDISAISWSIVVNQIVKLKDSLDSSVNPMLKKLDAHNIANRILRKENYMISMFNKGVLNLIIPVFGKRKMLTSIMEWSLWICIVDFVFDEHGTIKKSFLRDSNRTKLAKDLKRRFAIFGMLNFIFSPFLLTVYILYYFFRYAEEYHKNPKSLGARQYSRFAWWTFREFNELPHLFEERLNRSYKNAAEYMNQFKRESVVIIARFVSFIAGSFAVTLTIISLIDQALLVDFEITPGGSVLFYIGLFGGIFAAGNSLIPEGHTVLEPETLIRDVISEIHYLPDDWRDKLHTEEVRDQFGLLFEYNIVLLLAELLSLAFGPFIFWYSLSDSSEAIVDFFREFTVHVDSLGYVCSFAVFDFKRNGNTKYGAQPESGNNNFASNQGKMEQSFLDFKAQNPNWEPDLHGSMYLSTVLSKRADNIQNRDESAPSNTRKRPLIKSQSRPYGGGYRSHMNNSTSRPPPPPKSPSANIESGSSSIQGDSKSFESKSFLNPNVYIDTRGGGVQGGSVASDGADFFALLNDIYEKNRE